MSKVFFKTLIGGFSCINTRLTFHPQILLPKDNVGKHKLIFDLKISNVNGKKRITTKTLNMDKNNQYGQVMTKPLPYDCIKKKKKPPTLLEFNRILDSISQEGTIDHLFIFDIKFHNKNRKTMFVIEIYPPTFGKKKDRTCPRKVYHSINERVKQKYGKRHHKQLQMQLQNPFNPR